MTLPRDQKLDLPNASLPRPRAIPVALRDPGLRCDLAQLRADLSRNLGLHQLPGDQHDRLAHEILKAAIANLRDDISSRHPLTFGHRGVSFSSDSWLSRRA
jgi:hypothetical protein